MDVGCMMANFAKAGGMDIVDKWPLMPEDYRRLNMRVYDKGSVSSVLREPVSEMLLTNLFSLKLRCSAKCKWNVVEKDSGKKINKKGTMEWNRWGLRQRSVLREMFARRAKLPADLAHAGLHNILELSFPRVKDKALLNLVQEEGVDS